MAKAHADVAYDNGLAVGTGDRAVGGLGAGSRGGVGLDVQGRVAVGDNQVPHAQGVADHGHVRTGQVIVDRRVVPELPQKLLLGTQCLLVRGIILDVSKGALCPVMLCGHRFLP